MSHNVSRRLFLGGSAAATAIGASGLITSAGLQAATPAMSKVLYGPKPGIAKLNANENPFGPSKAALKAIATASAAG